MKICLMYLIKLLIKLITNFEYIDLGGGNGN